MSVRIERITWGDPRGAALRRAMDEEVGPRYAPGLAEATPEDRAARTGVFRIDPETMVGVHLALEPDGTPIGHAALRRLPVGDAVEWELKRLVTLPAARGRGVGRLLVAAVEADARERGARRLILQTGDKQPEAIGLYERLGYRPIPAYPPYAGVLPEGLYFARAIG